MKSSSSRSSPDRSARRSLRRDVGHFDHWARRYDRSWTQRIFFAPVHRRVMELAAALVPDPARILDIGCGTGAFLRLAAQRFPKAELVGVDASTEMIKMAHAANPCPGRLTFVREQAERLPFAEREFELIVSTISFHHWVEQTRGLSEVARVLAPGGSFLLADHFDIPPHRVFYATPGRRRRFHTPAEIDAMLKCAGFVRMAWHDVHKIGPLPLVAGVAATRP